ncbi:MAG: methyl-accepting chemotaxis protein, partial [Gammaproteobacteria bacterium]
PFSIMLQTKYMTNTNTLATPQLEPQGTTNNSSNNIDLYAAVHDKYHAFFRKLIDEYKYSDLLLADLNGNIIYSTKKNIDFASSLISGAFSNAEIANVFNATKYSNPNEDSVVLSNFSEYLPDYQEPVLFVASKVQNLGVLIASVGLSSINSLLKLPDNIANTSIYLIDQDLHLISNHNLEKTINTLAAREAAAGKKGFIEGLNTNKAMALSYFAPIEDRGLSIIVESNKDTILQNLSKSITNMLIFTGAVIPILLFFVYTIYCLCIEKADNKLNKLSTFMQVVLAKKDLNSRINLSSTDANGIANILNNMLSWFQNTLDQVAFKIKQFINKHNDLFTNITDVSNHIQEKQPLIDTAKDLAANLSKNSDQLQNNLEQHFNTINAHKEACLALNSLNLQANQKQNITNLTSAVEYILSICNLADMLALHISLEASKKGHQQDNNFLLLSKEIKKMVTSLKSRLIQIKDSFDSYILEHDTINSFITEFSEKLKPINSSLEQLLESQKTLLDNSTNTQIITNHLQTNLLDLETKYNVVNQQLLTLVEDNNKLNVELQIDDYYPFKIVENTAN